MRETRTFTVLAVSALILAMAAMLAAPAQAGTPRGGLHVAAPTPTPRSHGSDEGAWGRSRTVGGAAAMIAAAAALSFVAMQRTRAATT